MIAVVVVNYRQTTATLNCLESLYTHAGMSFHLFLIDNAADAESRLAITHFLADDPCRVGTFTLLSNQENFGFSGGCNQALGLILADARFRVVAILNNDCLVEPNWLVRLTEGLAPDRKVEMVASRMMNLNRPDDVDNLGITLYRSGIASNRKDADNPLLGPCGGGALYSVGLLNALVSTDGYIFDPDFFCYAEDTDLAMRARALGYDCAFADDAVLLHFGSLATGGASNTFVAYYGLRNSLFAMIKNLSADFIGRNIGWILLMQCAVTAKYIIKGHPRVIWNVYRDLLRALPRLLAQRRHHQARTVLARGSWRDWTCMRFYDPAYIFQGLRTLHRQDLRSSPDI